MKPPHSRSGHWFFKLDCRTFLDSGVAHYDDELYMMFKDDKPCSPYVFRIVKDSSIRNVERLMGESRFVVIDVVSNAHDTSVFSSKYAIRSCVFDTKTDRVVALTRSGGASVYGNIALLWDDDDILYLPSGTVSFEIPCHVKVLADSENEIVICDDEKKYGFLATVNKETGEVTVVKDKK